MDKQFQKSFKALVDFLFIVLSPFIRLFTYVTETTKRKIIFGAASFISLIVLIFVLFSVLQQKWTNDQLRIIEWLINTDRVNSSDIKQFINEHETIGPHVLEFPIATDVSVIQTFVVKDYFKNNDFIVVDDQLPAWFLDKVEKPSHRTTLYGRILLKPSTTESIIKALNGQDNAETQLAEIYNLVTAQKNGQDGILLTKAFIGNIFFVRGADNQLHSIYVLWIGSRWVVGPGETPGENYRWSIGRQVFSRT